jgi:hypothetical protein
MGTTVPSIFNMISSYPYNDSVESVTIVLILQMRKLSPQEVKQIAPAHTFHTPEGQSSLTLQNYIPLTQYSMLIKNMASGDRQSLAFTSHSSVILIFFL